MATITFEGKNYPTFGELPNVGSSAPDIKLVDTELNNVSLANWIGKRKLMNIIVSIDTEVCAKSVVEFSKAARGHDDLALLTVSYDLPFAHRHFHKDKDIDNTTGLSAIRHEGFGENYGVQIMQGPLAGMFSRAVVVLDENNTVVYTEQVEDIATEPDYVSAFRALGLDAA
ncbi:MAG: thiol peroxidase [Pseudomonadota bacterium]